MTLLGDEEEVGGVDGVCHGVEGRASGHVR